MAVQTRQQAVQPEEREYLRAEEQASITVLLPLGATDTHFIVSSSTQFASGAGRSVTKLRKNLHRKICCG